MYVDNVISTCGNIRVTTGYPGVKKLIRNKYRFVWECYILHALQCLSTNCDVMPYAMSCRCAFHCLKRTKMLIITMIMIMTILKIVIMVIILIIILKEKPILQLLIK